LSTGVGGVLLPAQIRDYGVDKATVGLTFFAFSAGFMSAGATAGGLIHRFGIRAVLAAGGGCVMVAGLYTATRPPFVAFVAVQLVAGYGMGVLESALNAYLSELPGATTLLNRLHAFFGVGALIGPALAAWMLGVLPWTAVWLVLGLACLPLVAGFLLAFPSSAGPGEGGPAAPAPGVPPAPSAAGGLLGAAVREPAVRLGALFLAVYVGLEIAVGNWGFNFLVDEHGQRALLAGYTISGYWLGLTAGRFLISPVAGRAGLTATGTVFACLAGVTASAVSIWLAPGGALAGAGLVLLGFFLGPIFPTSMALVPRLTSARLVPTAIGLMNGVSVVGGAVLPWLAGAIAQGFGAWTLLPFTVTLALLQLMIWSRLAQRVTTSRPA
jgi:fucose permease